MRPVLGYNLVEVLVTLAIASIITITLVSFVNDVDTRQKVAIARADVARIAEAAHLAEAQIQSTTYVSVPILNLTSTSALSYYLAPKLVELPTEDPWGNRFVRVNNPDGSVGYVRSTSAMDASSGTPYIIDEGLGRVISAGPDGVVDTHIGQDPADSDADIVVEYRHKPWLFYNISDRLYINSADGAANPASPGRAGIDLGEGTNAQVSPDGLHFAAIVGGNALVEGTLAWAAQPEGAGPTPQTSPVTIVPRSQILSYSSSGGTTAVDVQVTADTDMVPVWLPDSSGVLFFTKDGDIFRWDPSRGAVLRLTGQTKLGITGASTKARLVGANRRNAFCIDPDLGVWMVVSSDGKVAYRATDGSIAMVLSDGTSSRTIKRNLPSSDLYPLAWIDSNNLAYWDKPASKLGRIAQDGTLDIPLHDVTQVKVTNVIDPMISGDGKYLAFLESSTVGRVAKTDGTGLVDGVQGNGPTRTWVFSPQGAQISAPISPIVWKQNLDCASNHLFYLPCSGANNVLKCMMVDSSDNFYPEGQSASARSFTNPDDCSRGGSAFASTQYDLPDGMDLLSYDLSRDEKLLAIVSDKDSTLHPSGGGGVFVIPIGGDARAMTHLSPPSRPVQGGYNYVSWLLN